MELADVVAQLQQRAPYLRCADAAPPADGWLACAELISRPDLLRREIDATAAGRGTDDAQVAASLYAQAYAFRVSSIAVGAYALGLPGPTLGPECTAVRTARHRPAELAVTTPALYERDASTLAAELLEGHLEPFVAAVRAGTRIGERLLWGNVAASVATVFRAVHGSGPRGDESVRARAAELFTAAENSFAGLGAWSTVEADGALGWYWDRTSCCLWYLASGGSTCDDCSLHDPVARLAVRRSELAGPAS